MAAESGTQAGAERWRHWRAAVGAVVIVPLLALAVTGGGSMLRERRPSMPAQKNASPAKAAAQERSPAAPATSRAIPESREAALPRGRESGWVREAPRAPLGPSQIVPLVPEKVPGAAPAPPRREPGEPRPTLLFQPVASAAGRIEVAGHVVELEGVEVLDAAAQCTGSDGRPWPCGTVARAAFRAWLRGRAVECTVAPTPGEKPVVSACRLGRQDAGAWLVANGFAAALPDGAYAQAGAEAKAARRGIFGDRPKRVSMTVGAGGGILPDLRQQTTDAGEAAPAAPPAAGEAPVDAPAPAESAPVEPGAVTPAP